MTERRLNTGFLVPLVIGALLSAGMITVGLVFQDRYLAEWRARTAAEAIAALEAAEEEEGEKGPKWPPPEYLEDSTWRLLRFDDDGWMTLTAGTYAELVNRLEKLRGDQPVPEQAELVIPIFPTVYTPLLEDKIYYDAIQKSGIEPDDKVLVIGTGSGADAWAVSLKTDQPVYVIDINPVAIVNAKATAVLGRFEIVTAVGDATKIELPETYRDFDYVLWNMPYIQPTATPKSFLDQNYHDGDNGRILDDFLVLLPSLLKEDGTAMLLNSAMAEPYMLFDDVEKTVVDTCTLFVFPNPGDEGVAKAAERRAQAQEQAAAKADKDAG